MNKNFIIKGDIAYSELDRTLTCKPNCYLIVTNGLVDGVFENIPSSFVNYELIDKTGMLIIPGLVDLHMHAPQYPYRGTKMDVQLLEWLEKYTFPEESKYQDNEYALKAYKVFANDLKNSLTTRAVIFATIHEDATTILSSLLEETNLKAYVGMLNMDRNAPSYYLHQSVEESISKLETYINSVKDLKNVKPIITPRFTPTTTDGLMKALGDIKLKYGFKVQSHLDENVNEIAWVKELCPDSKNYSDTYDRFGLLEGSVMAHCIHVPDDELNLLKERNVYIAHCPDSNVNVCSGIAQIKKYLDLGLHVGIGSDIAGGSNINLLANLKLAIQVSKVVKMNTNGLYDALTIDDAFYIGTLGGASFFAKTGSFLPKYEADILIIDDSKNNRSPYELSIKDRIERLVYFGNESLLDSKYVAGTKINLDK